MPNGLRMRNQRRIDTVSELTKAVITEDGYMYCDIYATRAGVFQYRNPDGSMRNEFRPPEEVGNPDSLASLARKPITDEHPVDFVNSDNAKELSKGLVDPDVEWVESYEDGYVRVKGTVQQSELVQKIDSGKVEVSCGYTADIFEEPGEWTDSRGVVHRYDTVQRNIRYNHLAVVDKGRAGKNVRIRTDAAIQDRDITTGDDMTTQRQYIRIDGRDVPSDDARLIQDAAAVLEKRVADMEAEMEDMKGEKSKLEDMKSKLADMEKAYADMEGEKKALEAAIAKLEEEAEAAPKMDAADVQKLVNARLELLSLAKEKGAEVKDSMSNEEIKRAVVLTRFDSDVLEDGADLETLYRAVSKIKNKVKADSLSNSIVGSTKVEDSKDVIDLMAAYNNSITGAK